jgi:hypothetical protein
MEQLPFTDISLSDDEYKDECDRLSTIEAQEYHTSWGRWFLEDGMLCTWVCVPKTGVHVFGTLFKYEVRFEKKKSERKEWLDIVEDKAWIGERGLKDLKRAFKFLDKHGKMDNAIEQ